MAWNCEICKGAGFRCSANYTPGCECSKPEICPSCNGSGKDPSSPVEHFQDIDRNIRNIVLDEVISRLENSNSDLFDIVMMNFLNERVLDIIKEMKNE